MENNNSSITENKTEECHQVFKNDPKYFKSLINKTVEIATIDGKSHTGKVYVVDPVSESVVTVSHEPNGYNMNIYVGHAIKSMKVVENPKHWLMSSFCKAQDSDELIEKRTALKSWLKKNLFDVQEDGVNLKREDEDLLIEPPYDNAHCFCSNAIVLERVRDIISKMPKSNT